MKHQQQSLQTAFGSFNLRGENANSQAWNQADNYLLEQLAQNIELTTQGIATINDQFGALSVATSSFNLEIYNDSAIFKHWLDINWPRNLLESPLEKQTNNQQQPVIKPIHFLSQSTQKTFLLRLPKNLHFFQHQLSLLSHLQDINVIVAGMQKYWPKSFYDTAYAYFENVNVLPGVKKAKCMLLSTGKQNPLPEITQTLYFAEHNLNVINYPNVFSREDLDIGTRFFLENFPDLSHCENIIDLACGNGILGIKALQLNPHANMCFIDESWYATESCRHSLALNHIPPDRFEIFHNDSFYQLKLSQVDAILCNPPFHQQHTVSDHTTKTMIQQCFQHLKSGGKLFLIGNRHMQYHIPLKKRFSQVTQYAANEKFILYQAIKN